MNRFLILAAFVLLCLGHATSALAIQSGYAEHGYTTGHLGLNLWGKEKYWIIDGKSWHPKASTAYAISYSGPDLGHLMQYEYELRNDAMDLIFTQTAAQVQSFGMTLRAPSTADTAPQFQLQITDYHVVGAGGFEVIGPAEGWLLDVALTTTEMLPDGSLSLTYRGQLTTTGLQVNIPGFTSGFMTALDATPMDFEFSTVVPEPSSLALASLGLVGLLRRRR